MFRFRDLSIKHKLTLLSVLASGSALILACVAFVAYDGWTFRDAMVQTISTQAKIVGYNSAASLLFGVPQSASETLAALSAEPGIVSADIYTVDRKVFASYVRDRGASNKANVIRTPSVPAEGHAFEADHLELWRPVVFGGNVLGTVAIRANLESMRARRLQYVGIAIVVLLISTVGSIFVSLWFQRRISQPILGLATIAKNVSRNKDFSVRARAESRDEVGLLVETFNEMLGRIQEQNSQLQQSHEELEQRVIERTTQLEAANKELEAFSYSVSHDLRAPLRGIDGFSQALLEDYEEKLDARGKDYLQRVRVASQRMAQLIDDMLGLSRASRGEMRHEPVDLTGISRSIAAQLQDADTGRHVEFVIAEGLCARGDPRLLQIVLENLIGNAWKFTGKQPTARVEVGVNDNNGRSVYFVRDNGAGFDMTYAEKLFGAFQRLHSAAEFKGTGIGLATVQRIIRRHGGEVWAEGKVGQGAVFYFTL
jgi:signal transduction histidine kinase